MYFGDFAPNVRPIAARRARLQLAQGDLDRGAPGRAARPGRRRRALLPARVRAHHPGDGAAGPAPGRARHQRPRTWRDGCSSGCWPQRRQAAGWQRASRSSCSWRWPARPKATGHGPRTSRSRPGPGGAEGHLRVFLDAGPALSALLHSTSRRGLAGRNIARAVLAVRGDQETRSPTPPRQRQPSAHGTASRRPLSERELDVLRLLDSDLGGPDIARELSVSVNTVRTHTRTSTPSSASPAGAKPCAKPHAWVCCATASR